ncbi:MAG TPA: hypothetical protein VEB40_16080 [Flavipsychrobacter sp.]|nr:hypothetical protein [Flavipsychrobacter sp.]
MLKTSSLCLCFVLSIAACRPEEKFPTKVQPEIAENIIQHNSHPGHITNSIQSKNGDIMACGTDNAGNSVLWAISHNYGTIIWSKSYPVSEYGTFADLEEKKDGGFMICGIKTSDDGNADIHMCNVTDEGLIVWHKSVGSPQDEVNVSMTRATGGQYVVVAAQKNSTYDLFDMWMTESGSEWHLVFEQPGEQIPYCVTPDAAGGIIITGTHNDNIVSPARLQVLKLGNFLDTIFNLSKLMNNGHTIARHSIEIANGAVITCGSRSIAGMVRGFVCKISKTGVIEWDREYSCDSNLVIEKLVSDGDGFKVAGHVYGNCTGCNSRSLLISLDVQGNELWRNIYEPENNKDETAVNLFPGNKSALLQNSKDRNTGEERFFVQYIDQKGAALE